MDLQTSVILLLSFSLAATIKGEKIEEEGGKGRSENGACVVTLSYNLCRPTGFAVDVIMRVSGKLFGNAEGGKHLVFTIS